MRCLEEEAQALQCHEVPYHLVEHELDTQPDVTTETKLIFLIFGASAGLFWQELLNCLPTIVQHLYTNAHDLSSTTTTAFNSAVLLATIPLVVFDPMRRSLVIIAASILSFAPLATALICQYALRQTDWGFIAFVAISILAGLASGMLESVTFAHAVCLHRIKLSAWFSMGFGASGVLSYAYWVFTTDMLFSTSTMEGGVAAIWSQQIMAAVFGLAALAAILRLKHRPEYRQWKLRRQEESVVSSRLSSVRSTDDSAVLEDVLPCHSTTESTSTAVSRPLLVDPTIRNLTPFSSTEVIGGVLSPSHGTEIHLAPKAALEPSANVLRVAWQTAACQWHLGLILWISFAIVPNLVPLGLRLSTKSQDRLTGFYQICDFFGRYLANFRGLQLSKQASCHLSHARIVLLVLAVLSFECPNLPLSKSLVVQSLMVTLTGLSNGWLLTLFFMHLGEGLESDRKKGCATSISVMTQLVGVVAGLWFAAGLRDGI